MKLLPVFGRIRDGYLWKRIFFIPIFFTNWKTTYLMDIFPMAVIITALPRIIVRMNFASGEYGINITNSRG